MTDTELLRSPTEVLYAVSDKQRERERAAAAAAANASHSMASQTMQSELQKKSRSRATSRQGDICILSGTIPEYPRNLLPNEFPSSCFQGGLALRQRQRQPEPVRHEH